MRRCASAAGAATSARSPPGVEYSRTHGVTHPRVSAPSDSDDEQIAAFEAYYYQAYSQLGYPDGDDAYLKPLLKNAPAPKRVKAAE